MIFYPLNHGERLHQVFQRTRTELENLLAGYVLPDPFFTDRVSFPVKSSACWTRLGSSRSKRATIFPASSTAPGLLTKWTLKHVLKRQ
jgi:hypothetical protein